MLGYANLGPSVFTITLSNVVRLLQDFVSKLLHTGWSKKRHKVNDTIILQPYIIESCGFQQNVPKEILYMTI